VPDLDGPRLRADDDHPPAGGGPEARDGAAGRGKFVGPDEVDPVHGSRIDRRRGEPRRHAAGAASHEKRGLPDEPRGGGYAMRGVWEEVHEFRFDDVTAVADVVPGQLAVRPDGVDRAAHSAHQQVRRQPPALHSPEGELRPRERDLRLPGEQVALLAHLLDADNSVGGQGDEDRTAFPGGVIDAHDGLAGAEIDGCIQFDA